MSIKKNLTFKVIVTLLAVGIVSVLFMAYKLNITTIDGIKEYIRSLGAFGVLVYIILFNLKTVLIVIPYGIFVILGGSIFGSIVGFLISIFCVVTSSAIAFNISRHAGKEKMQRFLKGKFKDLDMKTGEKGFNIILFMRLSCLFPADALSFAAGLTQIKFSEFLLATFIGTLPEAFSLSMLGDNIRNPLSKEFLFSILLVVATGTTSLVIQRIVKKNKTV